MNKWIVTERIAQIRADIGDCFIKDGLYKDQTGDQRRKLRIMMAEVLALEWYLNGTDLHQWLNTQIEQENYCGCEVIKRAILFTKKEPCEI